MKFQGPILLLGAICEPSLIKAAVFSSLCQRDLPPSSWHPLKSTVYEVTCLCREANSPFAKCLFGMWIISN